MSGFSALLDALPPGLLASPDLPATRAWLAGLPVELAPYPLYLEWGLASGALDLDLVLPTTMMDGLVRLAIEELFEPLTLDGRGALDATLARVRATPLDDPAFPVAVTVALDRPGTDRVAFVFVDHRPELPPALRARAFALLGATRGPALDALDRHLGALALGHAGLGAREGRTLHKAYAVGTLSSALAAARAGEAAALLAPHDDALDALARAAGPRRAHLVVDVAEGRAVRVGFELNFGHHGDPEHLALVTGSELWARGPRPDLSPLARPLQPPGGLVALSHLKVSFRGDGEPEWKAYFALAST